MSIDEDDYLMISGIQHFAFCRRQWGIIHIEMKWNENYNTMSGFLMHENAHNQSFTEKRGGMIVTRNMPIISHSLKAYGFCDVVEFHENENGVPLCGRKGLWKPIPIEYKVGNVKFHDADKLQLCAQAISLEEMLACNRIDTAYLFYGETKHRETICLTDSLRDTVYNMFAEMQNYYSRQYIPKVKEKKECRSCSLKDICLPELPQEEVVETYIRKALES